MSLNGNNVLTVLFLNTLFCAMLMSPVIVSGVTVADVGLAGCVGGHFRIVIKALIVLGSWLLGYFSIKELPLTIAGPINATRPIVVLVGALIVFGERLNWMQWLGVGLGVCSLYLVSCIGRREGFSLRRSRWLWMAMGAMMLGAVSGLYDKYLLRMYEPLEVQAWYLLYQCVIMGGVILIIKRIKGDASSFVWKWTIPCVSIFLTLADMAYFYSLSLEDSMVSVVSMIRRGSVLVSFVYGVLVLREKNVKMKLVDLSILLIGLIFLVIGSSNSLI